MPSNRQESASLLPASAGRHRSAAAYGSTALNPSANPEDAAPLLPNSTSRPDGERAEDGDESDEAQAVAKAPVKRTPLPKVQLFIACFVRVTEPIAFLSCFPYINQMIIDLHIVDDPKKTGFYAGLVSPVTLLSKTEAGYAHLFTLCSPFAHRVRFWQMCNSADA